jgi:hypothetical protein
MLRVALIAATIGAIGTGGMYLLWRSETATVDRLEKRIIGLEAQLANTTARLNLLRDEMESDNAVDEIPDSDLPDFVDPRWLRPGSSPD